MFINPSYEGAPEEGAKEEGDEVAFKLKGYRVFRDSSH